MDICGVWITSLIHFRVCYTNLNTLAFYLFNWFPQRMVDVDRKFMIINLKSTNQHIYDM